MPATGLALFAFTTPAHAEDASTFSVLPATVSISAPDGADAAQPELSEVQVTVTSVVASLPVEPAGDGSAADPVAVFEAAPKEAVAEVPASVESPANQAQSTSPADPSGSPDSSSDLVATQPTQDNVDHAQAAAISNAQLSGAAPEARAIAAPEDTVAQTVDSRPSAQYQSTPKQYQARRAVDSQPLRKRMAAVAPTARRTVRDGRAHLVRDSAKSVQILSLICADIDGGNPVISVGNDESKSDWNIAQIGSCIVDVSHSEEVPEGVATPPACELASQYQQQEGQYQSVACEPGGAEPNDAGPIPPSVCMPDAGKAIDQVSPIELVIGDFIPVDDSSTTCVAGPAAGTATPPPVSNPPGPGSPTAEAGTGMSTVPPASPVSQPARTPTRPVESGKQGTGRRASRPTRVDLRSPADRVTTARPLPSKVQSPRARPHPAEAKHRVVPPTNPETSGPPARVEALGAQRSGRSSSSGAGASSGSAWLTAVAMLLLFGLGSFGLAVARFPGRASPALVTRLRSRITSKGLSTHPTDGPQVHGSRGIRYRD